MLHKFLIWFDQKFPIDTSAPLRGFVSLLVRRTLYRDLNLIAAPDAPPVVRAEPAHPYRIPDAYGSDVKNALTGARNTPFGRNMPACDRGRDGLDNPPVQLVAEKLLARRAFQPAGAQLNILAAARIQFMSHDWMRGAQTEEEAVLEKVGCVVR